MPTISPTHFNEDETFAAPGIAVSDHLGGLNRSTLTKQIF
jgi:hypothetical protein